MKLQIFNEFGSPLNLQGIDSIKFRFPYDNGEVLEKNNAEILDFHVQNEAFATMAVRPFESQVQFGVVETEGVNIVAFEEKPFFRAKINAGVYVLDPMFISYLEKSQPCDMPELFDLIRNNGHRTIAYPIHERWIDIGRHEDLDKVVRSTSVWEESGNQIT